MTNFRNSGLYGLLDHNAASQGHILDDGVGRGLAG